MLIQVMLLEKSEKQLSGDAIKIIFEQGVKNMYGERYKKEGGIKEPKKVSLNMGVYKWSPEVEKIMRMSCDNMALMVKLPGVSKDNIKNNGGVLGNGVAMGLYNMMLNDVLDQKDTDEMEVCVARVLEYDKEFLSTYSEGNDISELLKNTQSGVGRALETLFSDYDFIYMNIPEDAVDKVNSIYGDDSNVEK